MKTFNEKVKLAGGAQLPASAAAGKLLISDASGNFSWKTLAEASVASLDANGHVPESQNPMRSGFQMIDAFGHSYTINGDVSGYSYVERLAYLLNARRRNNRGWGGAIACWPNLGATGDGGYAWVLQEMQRPGSPVVGQKPAHPESAGAPYVPRAQLAVVHYGLNDLAQLGSTKPRPFQEALRTIVSRICAAAIWENTSGQWAYTGTWSVNTSTTSNSGPDFKYSSVLNDKATFTLPSDYETGKVVAIGLFLNATHDLTIGVKVDGVAQTDARLQASALCDTSTKHMGIVLRFDPSYGGAARSPFDYPVALNPSSTIELTLKTQTVGSSLLGIDYAQVEADPAYGPIIVAPRPSRTYDYTIWNSYPHGPSAGTDPMNDAAVATWDTAYQATLAEFQSRVVLVDIDTPINKQLALFSADHAHLNNRGWAVVADAVHDAVRNSGLVTKQALNRAIVDISPFFEPVGTAGRTAFTNSWTQYGSGSDPFGFHYHLDGRCELRGAVKSGSSGASGVATVPGHPANDKYISATGNGSWGNAKVSSAGVVSMSTGGSTTFECFDGVNFSREA